MDPAVIYDPDLEMSALVDTDTMRALGPVGVGPDSQAQMQQFITIMPEAVLGMSSFELVVAWSQFWTANFEGLIVATGAGAAGAVDADGNLDGDAAALAAREALEHADGPPPPQPADTDTEAVASTPPVIVDCFACNGTGRVPGATEGAEQQCNLCNGGGKIQQPAPAQ